MTFVSYAQNFEDVMLWRALKSVDRGFYIDVGANHPRFDSVTKAFYDRGWHGINIEPIGTLWRQLDAERPSDVNLRLIVANAPSITTFYEVENSGLSTTEPEIAEKYRQAGIAVKEISVAADTLAQICAAHVRSDVHFLKIDVEGGTRSVLDGADFERFRPWIILAEATQPLSQIEDYSEWEALITERGYDFVYADGLNRFYLAREKGGLRSHFKYPPNVFDDFVSATYQRASDPRSTVPTLALTSRSHGFFQLMSFWETVLYFDEGAGQLRHAPQPDAPKNLLLRVEGRRGFLYVFGIAAGEVCAIETFIHRRIAQVGVIDGESCVTVDQLGENRVSLRFDGKFLCCNPDGTAYFDRDWCEAWETFKLNERKHLFF